MQLNINGGLTTSDDSTGAPGGLPTATTSYSALGIILGNTQFAAYLTNKETELNASNTNKWSQLGANKESVQQIASIAASFSPQPR